MSHLDLAQWRDLLAGRLDAERRTAIAAHLQQGCEQCETLIAEAAELADADPLDGLVDEALFELAPAAEVSGLDELGFARVQRGLRARRARPWMAGLGALAAAAAVALVLLPSEQTRWRTKGSAVEQARAQLEVLAVVDGQPRPLARGSAVAVGTALVFRVRLDRPGCVQLWQQGNGQQGNGALLDTPLCLPAGSQVLAHDGEPLGLTADRPGTLVFELRRVADPDAEARADPATELRALDDPPGRFTLEVGQAAADALP